MCVCVTLCMSVPVGMCVCLSRWVCERVSESDSDSLGECN